MAQSAFHSIKKSTKLINRKGTKPGGFRKTSKFLTLAAIVTLSSQAAIRPTSATSLQQTWSFAEATGLGIKYQSIVEAECHRDADCEKAVYRRYLDSDDPDQVAAALFNTNAFAITSLDPYRGEFTYYYNDINPEFEKRDFRSYPVYGYQKFEITFYFDNGGKYIFHPSIVKGRQIDGYTIVSTKIPTNHYINKMRVEMITRGNDFEALDHVDYTNDFSGCLNSDGFERGMFCETYFDSQLKLQSRAVLPEAVDIEYVEPEPKPEPKPEPSPTLPESGGDHESSGGHESDSLLENKLPTGVPEVDPVTNSNQADLTTNPDQTDPVATELAVANPESQNQISLANGNLPLAPNTGLGKLLSAHFNHLGQGTVSLSSTRQPNSARRSSLILFASILAILNLLMLCGYLSQKCRKSAKNLKKVVKKC